MWTDFRLDIGPHVKCSVVNLEAITAWGETKGLIDWLKDPRCTSSRDRLKMHLSAGMPAELAIAQMGIPGKKRFHGVSYDASKKKWKAQVWDQSTRTTKHLGWFQSEIMAAEAYDQEVRSRSNVAKTNF